MALGAILLAWAMYWLDGRISSEALADSRFVLAGTVDDLRSGLLSMAATVLTTAGIVFTLLTLPLSTVATQYGSRLLRLFLRDRTTRFVLGMFVATFVYSIAAALSISHAGFGLESPQLTATVGLYLMLATFASLILLVQHISTMLQAPNIAAAAGVELMEVVNAELPEEIASAASSRVSREGRTESGLPAAGDYVMRATKTGYIQSIDPQTIVTLAAEKDLTFQLLRGPGQFVCPDVVVARVWPAERKEGLRVDEID
jgi:uncharacterized membrane protein